jgi:peptidoglycan/LPS O-acetylase OafA/YrhL
MHAPIVSTGTSSAYRADIDGLRAVAVFLVVVFHAFPNEKFLPGGFVGVDVFFVISGYLISKILFAEIEEGRFSVASFYGRRSRRIFPALAVCLAAVLTYGFLVLLPSELAQLGKQTFFGAAFLSNFALWGESGYFDTASTSKPLLHLWSLGIEEQFYIVWPVLLLLAFRLKVSFGRMIAFLFAASFLTNIALSLTDVTSDFYLPASRFWELLTGAALAWRLETITMGARLRSTLSLVGLTAILTSALLFTPEMRFPGWWALIPVAGAAAIIAAGPNVFLNRTLLANRPVVSIGLISYPLYLWHWPLIAFSYVIRGKPPTSLMAFGLVVASLLLAWATYRLVEQPIRFGPNRMRRTLAVCIALATIGACGFVAWLTNGIPQRFPASINFHKINAATLDSTYAATSGMTVLESNSRRDYPLVSRIGHGDRTVVFIGNSAMLHYGPRVQQLSDEGRLKAVIYFITAPGCQPVPRIFDPTEFVECDAILKKLAELVQRKKVDTIILGASYVAKKGAHIVRGSEKVQLEGHAGGRAFYANLEDYIRELQHSARVYLVLGAPYSITRFNPHHMIERRITGLQIDRNSDVSIPVRDLRAINATNDQGLRSIASRTGASVLDPFPDICDEVDTCSPFFENGEPKFVDGAHLRPSFVRKNIHFFDFLVAGPPM